MQKQLTCTGKVKIGDEYIPLSELPEKQIEELGNQVRKNPMVALGYVVEETG